MTKRITQIALIVILSAVVVFEIGYIIKSNMVSEYSESEITPTPEPLPVVGDSKSEPEKDGEARIIVIDPGHGKPSTLMSDAEKAENGWVKNSSGEWGEWRHYKTGSSTVHCEGSGCSGRVTPNGACWYPIGNSDRNTEPDINLKNAIAAARYLEELGYTVRMTRSTNEENPSISKRLSYCYPDNDTSKPPEAEAYICIHSNASGGGAAGTAYIKAEGTYDQAWIDEGYVADSNRLGRLCNDNIVNMTSLEHHSGGEIDWEPELIAFCKSPVPCGYLEIGFFDNSSDLGILESESEKIGKAIAKGVDEFCRTHK